MRAAVRQILLGGAFSPLSLFTGGVVGAWYDPSDLTTLFQDSAGTTPVTADSDPVGLMLDKSGNGNHLLQATAGLRPLYKTSGGKHWIEGDGTDDFLRATFAITQPWERISALRQNTWTNNDRIIGAVLGATHGTLFQGGGSPNLAINSGGSVVFTAPLAQVMVVTERHAGASSRAAVDNNTYTTGNAGTSLPGGITLFADDLGASAAAARCYGLIMRGGTMTDAQIASTRAYLAAKQ
jgi:hypothetical protein